MFQVGKTRRQTSILAQMTSMHVPTTPATGSLFRYVLHRAIVSILLESPFRAR